MSIGARTVIGPGARIKESIILSDARVHDHSLILYTIVGNMIAVKNININDMILMIKVFKIFLKTSF